MILKNLADDIEHITDDSKVVSSAGDRPSRLMVYVLCQGISRCSWPEVGTEDIEVSDVTPRLPGILRRGVPEPVDEEI